MRSRACSIPKRVAGFGVRAAKRSRRFAATLLLAAVMGGCSPTLLRTPNPRMHGPESPAKKPTAESPPPATASIDTMQAPAAPVSDAASRETLAADSGASELDFAVAFGDSEFASMPEAPAPQQSQPRPARTEPWPAARAAQTIVQVPAREIRVALRRGISHLNLYSMGAVSIGAPGLERRLPARGRIAIQAGRAPFLVRIDAGPRRSKEFALPCTLLSQDSYNFIDLDGVGYRGSIVIVGQAGGQFTALNVIDVEEYLLGVVDLEIGARAPEEIEAVKAQAIAARTYAYKRMIDRRSEGYDVLSTIEDQVYGGVAAESRQSERAVRETEGEALAYGDSLINAYYHSTCGGKTANVNDVWNKPAMPYLVSTSDADGTGAAYCAISPSFRWSETWTTAQLSNILARTLAGNECSGALVGISVESRFSCGRVRSCRISLSHGACVCGGDGARFVLRPPGKERSILRSANFFVSSIDSRQVTIVGVGYGHGVGMCQMGAVGRARAGQSCEEILLAYYRGARIVRVVAENAQPAAPRQ